MRLIDADKISYLWHVDKDGEWHEGVTLHSMVDAVPTVDAAEVVRCGKCKFYDKVCVFDDCAKPQDHYCAYGERKDGASNG